MVPTVSQVESQAAQNAEVALEPGSVLEEQLLLVTWLLLGWGDPATHPEGAEVSSELAVTEDRGWDTTPLLRAQWLHPGCLCWSG